MRIRLLIVAAVGVLASAAILAWTFLGGMTEEDAFIVLAQAVATPLGEGARTPDGVAYSQAERERSLRACRTVLGEEGGISDGLPPGARVLAEHLEPIIRYRAMLLAEATRESEAQFGNRIDLLIEVGTLIGRLRPMKRVARRAGNAADWFKSILGVKSIAECIQIIDRDGEFGQNLQGLYTRIHETGANDSGLDVLAAHAPQVFLPPGDSPLLVETREVLQRDLWDVVKASSPFSSTPPELISQKVADEITLRSDVDVASEVIIRVTCVYLDDTQATYVHTLPSMEVGVPYSARYLGRAVLHEVRVQHWSKRAGGDALETGLASQSEITRIRKQALVSATDDFVGSERPCDGQVLRVCIEALEELRLPQESTEELLRRAHGVLEWSAEANVLVSKLDAACEEERVLSLLEESTRLSERELCGSRELLRAIGLARERQTSSSRLDELEIALREKGPGDAGKIADVYMECLSGVNGDACLVPHYQNLLDSASLALVSELSGENVDLRQVEALGALDRIYRKTNGRCPREAVLENAADSCIRGLASRAGKEEFGSVYSLLDGYLVLSAQRFRPAVVGAWVGSCLDRTEEELVPEGAEPITALGAVADQSSATQASELRDGLLAIAQEILDRTTKEADQAELDKVIELLGLVDAFLMQDHEEAFEEMGEELVESFHGAVSRDLEAILQARRIDGLEEAHGLLVGARQSAESEPVCRVLDASISRAVFLIAMAVRLDLSEAIALGRSPQSGQIEEGRSLLKKVVRRVSRCALVDVETREGLAFLGEVLEAETLWEKVHWYGRRGNGTQAFARLHVVEENLARLFYEHPHADVYYDGFSSRDWALYMRMEAARLILELNHSRGGVHDAVEIRTFQRVLDEAGAAMGDRRLESRSGQLRVDRWGSAPRPLDPALVLAR